MTRTQQAWSITMVGAALTACCYAWVDIPVAIYMHAHGSEVTGTVGRFLEELGKSHWFLIANIIIILATWRASRRTAYHHIGIFASIALSGILANVIKISVNRARPPLLFKEDVYGFAPLTFATDFMHSSFPSGHATTGLALAVAGSIVRPRAWWAFTLVGIAIAGGRIVYNVHYVSDVIAGATIGVVVALLVAPWASGRALREHKAR